MLSDEGYLQQLFWIGSLDTTLCPAKIGKNNCSFALIRCYYFAALMHTYFRISKKRVALFRLANHSEFT